MGSDSHYPEEAPSHLVTIDGFFIDRTPVTNAQFRAFVRATGHVTTAEVPPDPKDYPGALPAMIYAGSLVFSPPAGAVDLRDWSQWGRFLKGANWRRPYGARSVTRGLENHPVVHVSYSDALAYAGWAGKDLPTEAEWEFAARGRQEGDEFAWATSSPRVASILPTLGRGIFPTKICVRMASHALHRLLRSRRTATASMT
jgi:formylglycine-generating enzyme